MQDKKAMMDKSYLRVKAGHDVFVSDAFGIAANRRRAEDQFRSSDEVFHLMVNSIKDYGIIMLDPEGHIVTWNAGAHAIHGYQAEDVIGKSYSLFHAANDIEIRKMERELATASVLS
jgi:PAS domain-containing protein